MDNQPQRPTTNTSQEDSRVQPSNQQSSCVQLQSENKKARHLSKILVALAILIVIVAATAGAYYFKSREDTNSVASATASAKNVNRNVALANDDFGINTFNYLVQQSPNDNIFISPASLAMALGQ